MKKNNALRYFSLVTLMVVIILSGIVINSLGCNYEMHLSSKSADYFAVCRAGKFTVIERELKTHATWRVTALQIVVGHQLIFLVTDRTPIKTAAEDERAGLDDLNQLQRDVTMPLNYGWMMFGENRIAIFQHYPHAEIVQGHIDGWLDFYQRFIGHSR